MDQSSKKLWWEYSIPNIGAMVLIALFVAGGALALEMGKGWMSFALLYGLATIFYFLLGIISVLVELLRNGRRIEKLLESKSQ